MTAERKRAEGAEPLSPCACGYDLDREADVTKVIVHCKETGGPASLMERVCRARVLEILSQEVNVDAVVLSHFRETQYDRPAMELLQRLERVTSGFRHLALRNPFNTYFESRADLPAREKKDQEKECEVCPWNPMTFFDALAKSVTEREPSELYERFREDGARLLGATKPEVCNPCLAASRGEMEYMALQLMELRSFVLFEAFRVVEAEPSVP